jgi:hypothetical protein
MLSLVQRFEPGAVPNAIERDTVTVFEGGRRMYSALLRHQPGR